MLFNAAACVLCHLWLATFYYLTPLNSVSLLPIQKLPKIPFNCPLMLLHARRYILYLPLLTQINYSLTLSHIFLNSSSLSFSAALCQTVPSLIYFYKKNFLFKPSVGSKYYSTKVLCTIHNFFFFPAIRQEFFKHYLPLRTIWYFTTLVLANIFPTPKYV
jgi:hypothetical protein